MEERRTGEVRRRIMEVLEKTVDLKEELRVSGSKMVEVLHNKIGGQIFVDYIMKLMNQLTSLGNLNITSWEVVILLFLVGGGFLLGILLGRDRVFVLLLGSYISFALMGVIPFKKI